MANEKSLELIRNRTVFEEIDHRFVNESVTSVARYIDTLRFPIVVSQSQTGSYMPDKPKFEQMALYQNADIYADSGNGRVSDGLRGLELLSRTCKGIPIDNLFMFNNTIHSSSADQVKNASDDQLIQIVIDNLGLTFIMSNAKKVSPSLVEEFRTVCYRIGYQVRSGTFQKEPIQSTVLMYAKKLTLAAANSV